MEQSSRGGRIYLTFIGLALAGAGGLFALLLWKSYDRAKKMDAWAEVPCVILRSEVEVQQVDPTGPVERRLGILYGYHWEGVPRESELLSLRGSPWTGKENIVEAWVAKYPAGSTQQCLVNPVQPDQAVLERESKAPGYSIWFPLIFVVGGLGTVVGAWRR